MNNKHSNALSTASLGWLALVATPLFFSTNIIFGRAAISIDPFTLATLRWALSGLILFALIPPLWPVAKKLAREQWKLLALCGFLAMWVCGGLVYLALKYTTATNGTLIYTTPPLMIILIERFLRGRKIKGREVIGIIAATLGIVTIVTKGNLDTLTQLDFNRGDLMFLLAAFSWALYTLLLRSKSLEGYPTRVIFALTAGFGSLTLLPFALGELYWSGEYPATLGQWQMVAGIIVFSSLIPFSLYQFGNRIHGPSSASVFMYLLPPFGLALAWFFLGEVPDETTIIGCGLVLGGVIIATLPVGLSSNIGK